jgi:hypothetical protein
MEKQTTDFRLPCAESFAMGGDEARISIPVGMAPHDVLAMICRKPSAGDRPR